MAWPKGVPRKGHVKGSLHKEVPVGKPDGDPFAFPPDPVPPVTPRFSDLVAAVEGLAAKVAELSRRHEQRATVVNPRTESLIERLRRIDDEVHAWTNLAHWASSREDHRPVRAYAKACASSLRLQAIELIQAHMERLEEYRKKNPITAAAEKANN